MTSRILLVEDSMAGRNLAYRTLNSLGYVVMPAKDADEALILLGSERYDMLFTDIIMPGSMDGIALARVAHEHYPEMKILFTSGFSDVTAIDITELGAGYIAKPYRKSEIAALLRRMLLP